MPDAIHPALERLLDEYPEVARAVADDPYIAQALAENPGLADEYRQGMEKQEAMLAEHRAALRRPAGQEYDTIAFVIEDRELGVGVEPCVDIKINGASLIGEWKGTVGLHPDERVFIPESRFLPTMEDDGAQRGRRTAILRCICGCEGCCDSFATITISDAVVTWSDLDAMQDDRPLADGFEFERSAYEDALRRPA